MNYYSEIIKEQKNNIIYKSVKDYSKNKNDLQTYYNVGKLLYEAGKHYGEGIIKSYSQKLTTDLGKEYGISNLKNMRKFYLTFQKSQSLPDHLTWSYYCMLLPLKDINEINYYIKISIEQKLSYRELHTKIKNKEYELYK